MFRGILGFWDTPKIAAPSYDIPVSRLESLNQYTYIITLKNINHFQQHFHQQNDIMITVKNNNFEAPICYILCILPILGLWNHNNLHHPTCFPERHLWLPTASLLFLAASTASNAAVRAAVRSPGSCHRWIVGDSLGDHLFKIGALKNDGLSRFIQPIKPCFHQKHTIILLSILVLPFSSFPNPCPRPQWQQCL